MILWCPQTHPCLWFTHHTQLPFPHHHAVSSSSSNTHSLTFLCTETHSSKTSEVGANPESRPTLPIHQLFILFNSFPLSCPNHWWGGLWESTASCMHLLNKRVFRNLQCQMHSLKSCLHLPPEKWSLLTFQREVDRRGQMKYSLCFPYVQFHGNCTTCNFVSDNASHVFLSYGLFARQYIVFDVCVFKKKEYYICVLSVPLSGSVDWTCLSAAILDRGFYLLCSWSWWPTWNTAF